MDFGGIVLVLLMTPVLAAIGVTTLAAFALMVLLGLITEISLKVLPKAVGEATLVFEMPEAQALQQLNQWGALPLPVNASCWHAGALMVRLRGAKAAVEASDGAVAMAAIVAIGSPDQKDAVAVASAKGFAKAGNDADATAIAKIIQNPVKRDKTLLELTK